MKKTILIGTVLAAFMLVAVGFNSTVSANNIDRSDLPDIKKKISESIDWFPGYFLISLLIVLMDLVEMNEISWFPGYYMVIFFYLIYAVVVQSIGTFLHSSYYGNPLDHEWYPGQYLLTFIWAVALGLLLIIAMQYYEPVS